MINTFADGLINLLAGHVMRRDYAVCSHSAVYVNGISKSQQCNRVSKFKVSYQAGRTNSLVYEMGTRVQTAMKLDFRDDKFTKIIGLVSPFFRHEDAHLFSSDGSFI